MNCILEANHSAQKLLEIISKNFFHFRDESIYNNKTGYIYIMSIILINYYLFKIQNILYIISKIISTVYLFSLLIFVFYFKGYILHFILI